MWTMQFWKDALERGIKSAAQALILAWVGGDGLFNLLEVDVRVGAGVAAGGFLLSVLTSLVSLAGGQSGTASVVNDVAYLPARAAA